ncbi:MAG: Maf family nucleotide pyrophosphatase [Saprospiraceae bacterium]|jgi:septum formation protein
MLPLNRKIILASQSPRRSHLLREAGLSFEIRPTDIPEDFPEDMDVDQVAPYLARKKAEAARPWIQSDEIVLASDSVVILEGRIFNKPQDDAEAFAMLRALSGKMHRVITGVCLISKTQEMDFSGEAKVFFEPMDDAEIDFYVSTYRPFDKAGAYAVQEWIGLCKISRIEGTYSNIMGLPMDLVYKALKTFI